MCDNLALIQRDDGELANLTVHPDTLTPATMAMIGNFNPTGLWTTATHYDIRDVVEASGVSYVANTEHVSAAAFATDRTAGYWNIIGQSAGIQSEESIAALLTLPVASLRDGERRDVTNYYAGILGGGGDVFWDAASVLSHNGGTVFLPTGHVGAGRWRSTGGQWIIAARFGCLAGQSAATNTAAANAAIAAGSVIEFPDGTIDLNVLADITTSKIIFGQGRLTKLRFNSASDCFVSDVSATALATAHVEFHDLSFKNITNTPTSYIKIGKTLAGSINTLIERCYFDQCAATYCIDSVIGYGTTIRDTHFYSVTGSCIRLQDSLSQVLEYSFASNIDGVDITSCTGDGILIEGAQVLGISNTVIENVTGAGIITKALTNTAQAWDIHLNNVYFEANTGADCDFSNVDSNYWTHATFTGCTFVDTPTIALGSRSEVSLIGCHNSGASVCTISGSGNASAQLINCANFTQSGTFDWVELGGISSTRSTTKPRAYTSIWTTSGTAPSLGNGTLVSSYTRVGNTVVVQLILTAGSTTTFGTGTWSFTPPFNPGAAIGRMMGNVWILDSGTGQYFGTCYLDQGTTTIFPEVTAGVAITNTAPFTWAVDDKLALTLIYFT